MADKTITELLIENKLTLPGLNAAFYVAQSGQDAAMIWADMRLAIQRNTRCVYAEMYKKADGTYGGVKADGVRLKDCTVSSGSPNLSSPSYTFTSADIGKVICVGGTSVEDPRAPGPFSFRGTIVGINGTSAVLSGNMTIGGSTCVAVFGTNDTVALQEAYDIAGAPDASITTTWKQTGLGCLVLPVGIIMTTESIIPRTKVSVIGQGMRQSEIFWASAHQLGGGGETNAAVINGYGSNGSTRILRDVQFRDFTVNAYSAFTATYSYNCKTLVATHLINFVIRNCAFLGSPGTGIGVDYIANALIDGNYIENPGRLFQSGGGGGSGIDFQSNRSSGWAPYANSEWEGYVISNNTIYNPAVSGIRNTNDRVTLANIKTTIIGNRVFTTKASGKGIEDCGNNGALIIGNDTVCMTAQPNPGNANKDQESWGGILSYGGQRGIIAHNRIQGYHRGIRLMRFLYGSSNLLPDDYMVVGNMITGCDDKGISVEVDATYEVNSIDIRGNHIMDCGAEGISVTTGFLGTVGKVNDLIIQDNRIKNCGKLTAVAARKSGIYINVPVNGLLCDGNYIHDTQATPTMTLGVTVDTVLVENEFIKNNHIKKGIITAFNLINGGLLSQGAPTGNFN